MTQWYENLVCIPDGDLAYSNAEANVGPEILNYTEPCHWMWDFRVVYAKQEMLG